MYAHKPSHSWDAFQAASRFRRAIRHFAPTPIPEADVQELLATAALAPSSGNMQPYQLHWISDAALKFSIAQACNGQQAASSATELVVIAASPAIGRRTAKAQLAFVDASSTFGPESKAYYRKQVGMFQRILGLGSSAIWSPLVQLVSLFNPAMSLAPVGHTGCRHWAARNAIFAAQSLMLGAAARGIDSCPMEGFSASKVIKLLGLPRGTVIPLVIALGYRADGARVEERWRRPLSDVVVAH